MTRDKFNIYNLNKNSTKNSDTYYKEGFFTKLNTEELKHGINEKTIYTISKKRSEPTWMLNFRLSGYHAWLNMQEPHWLKGQYPKLNYNSYSYFSAPAENNKTQKKYEHSLKKIKISN